MFDLLENQGGGNSPLMHIMHIMLNGDEHYAKCLNSEVIEKLHELHAY